MRDNNSCFLNFCLKLVSVEEWCPGHVRWFKPSFPDLGKHLFTELRRKSVHCLDEPIKRKLHTDGDKNLSKCPLSSISAVELVLSFLHGGAHFPQIFSPALFIAKSNRVTDALNTVGNKSVDLAELLTVRGCDAEAMELLRATE